jgi:putative transposase
MRHRLYVHLVWTTRLREPQLNLWAASFLSEYLPTVAQQERGQVLAMGIVRTHLHLLIAVHPSTSIPRLIQRLKGGSATVSNREGQGRVAVRWAKGYNIESVSPRALEAARRYVTDQAAHHPDEAIIGWTSWETPNKPLCAGADPAPSG